MANGAANTRGRGAAERLDVLVVGGGPAGAAAAYWLAQKGRRVAIVDKARFPREKTCGDGITPRAVRELTDMGLGPSLERFHRFSGLRSVGGGRSLDLPWPAHPDYPSYGYVVRRRDLDQLVVDRAVEAGAVLWPETEAVEPLFEGGEPQGAIVRRKGEEEPQRVSARYLVVADGATSKFGRALGTSRSRSYPLASAIRGYFTSPAHDDPFIEGHLDVRDEHGTPLPGYGWVFPVGDGTVNVGVGALSSIGGRKWSLNTPRLLDTFVAKLPSRWGVTPESSTGSPVGGYLPMAQSVQPISGSSFVVVGDAAGLVNPLNGEGICYAYETGRFAAEALDRALATGSSDALLAYPERLEAEYGSYFRTARTFFRLLAWPPLIAALAGQGHRSAHLMEGVLRVFANVMRQENPGPTEFTYRLMSRLAALAPER